MSRQRPANAKKALMAELKAMPDAGARKICELIDDRINAAPLSRSGALGPLESWLTIAHGTLSWVDVFDHPKTRKLVRAYLNKVPR